MAVVCVRPLCQCHLNSHVEVGRANFAMAPEGLARRDRLTSGCSEPGPSGSDLVTSSPVSAGRSAESGRSSKVDANVNPDAPPDSSMLKIDQFARRYRVDNSKTTLQEFRNLSGSPILGTAYWVGLKLGLIKPNSQILDGPR